MTYNPIPGGRWMPIDQWFDLAGLSAAHYREPELDHGYDDDRRIPAPTPLRTGTHAAVRRQKRKAAQR